MAKGSVGNSFRHIGVRGAVGGRVGASRPGPVTLRWRTYLSDYPLRRTGGESRLREAYYRGQREGYSEFMEKINSFGRGGGPGALSPSEPHNALLGYEYPLEGYVTIVSDVVGGGTLFLKDRPSSLYTAHQMVHGRPRVLAKGQFIAQNWESVKAKVDAALNMREDLTWGAFANMGTTLSYFLEEYEEDMASNTLANIDDILYKIYSLWPEEWGLKEMGTYLYETDEEGRPIIQTDGNVPRSGWVLSLPENYKMPILSKLLRKLPDTKEDVHPKGLDGAAPVFNGQTVVYDIPVPGQGRIDAIIGQILLISEKLAEVEPEVYERAEIYEQLIDMRRDIDLIRETIDPKELKDEARLPDRATLRRIVARLQDIIDNKYFPRVLSPDLNKIISVLEDNQFLQGLLSGHSVTALIRRVIGNRREEAKLIAALKQIEKSYEAIWRAVHAGSVIKG